jgi:hypothetical protein
MVLDAGLDLARAGYPNIHVWAAVWAVAGWERLGGNWTNGGGGDPGDEAAEVRRGIMKNEVIVSELKHKLAKVTFVVEIQPEDDALERLSALLRAMAEYLDTHSLGWVDATRIENKPMCRTEPGKWVGTFYRIQEWQ